MDKPASIMPPPSTPFGERVARRLRDDHLIWLTTVGADGTPQPNPVWFLWDGETFLMYSLPDAARLAHIKRNHRVSLNLDGNGQGGDIIVIAGDALISPEDPPADQNATYSDKYKDFIARGFQTPANFAEQYSVPIRITPTKVRGH
jgi:PPOX class probable F420-dependent enzyme